MTSSMVSEYKNNITRLTNIVNQDLKYLLQARLAIPGDELANSMPVPCSTLDLVLCQSSDQVQSMRLDQVGLICDFGPSWSNI